jgi:hypothetical protein
LYDAATYSGVLRDGLVLYVSHDWFSLPPSDDCDADAAGGDDEESAAAIAPLGPRHPLAHPTESLELLLAAVDRVKNAYCDDKVGKVFLWIDFACTPLLLAPAANDLYAPSPAANMLDRVMEKCDLMLTVVHESEASVAAWTKTSSVASSTGSIFQDYHSPPFQRYLQHRWARLEMLYAAHVPLPPDLPTAASISIGASSSTELRRSRGKRRRGGKARAGSTRSDRFIAAAASPSTPGIEEEVEDAKAEEDDKGSRPPQTPGAVPEPEPVAPSSTPHQKPHGLLPPLFSSSEREDNNRLYNGAELAHTPLCRLNPLQVQQQGSARRSKGRGAGGREGTLREERLRGGVQFEAFFGRRAHLLFGRRELMANMPPIVLPFLTDAARDRDLNPLGPKEDGEAATTQFPDNSTRIQGLLVRLMPFRHMGAAGYTGEKINVGSLSVPVWLRHGQGQMSWSNGNQYRGAWSHDYMEGTGTFRSPSVGWYSGEFKLGLQHGRGRWVGVGGETYEGEWALGLRHGHGIYTWPDGARFDGEWVRDEIGIRGILTSASGTVYRGCFSGGLKSGTGSMLWPSGERYVGSWKENKRSGLGFYRSAPAKHSKVAASTFFTGQWRDGHKHGAGSMTLREGNTLHGVFLKDNLVRPWDTWEEPGACGPEGGGGEWVERSTVSPYATEPHKIIAQHQHEREEAEEAEEAEEEEEEEDDEGIASAFKAQFVSNVGI